MGSRFECNAVINSPSSAQQERKLRRHHLIFYLKVYDSAADRPLGFLGDITLEGMMVMSEQPLELGRVYELEVRNQAPQNQSGTMRCRARALWCQSDDINPEYYATGFRFEESPADAEQAIRRLIREIGFDNS